MKTLVLLAGLCSLLLGQARGEEAAGLRVLTFNIRYENKGDGLDAWVNRREAVAKQIAEHADVAGLQEALPVQRNWLGEKLTEFGVIGVGRKPNDTDEGVPVLFRKERFEPLASGTFWLSETPDVVASLSWESSLPRVCTWVKLRDRKAEAGKDVFWFYNVHLDHRSAAARDKGLGVVRARMGARTETEPVILVGDFNSDDKDRPIVNLLAGEKPTLITTYQSLNVSPGGTFNSFTDRTNGGVIDYIFTEKGLWKVRSGAVLRNTYEGKDGKARQISDHFGVEALLERVK